MFAKLFSTVRKNHSTPKPVYRRARRVLFEMLEDRQLMSATPWEIHMAQGVALNNRPLAGAPSVAAASNQQTTFNVNDLRNAYGLNSIKFGSTVGDGRGQTVAITGVGDDANIFSELSTFNNAMGLGGWNLTVVKETYNGQNPTAASTGWAGEIAMDVELVHAFAPGANIVLYEANQADPAGLYQVVDWARNRPGVSVVSMSWGHDGEFAHATSIDGLFTTPSGHSGVSFVAAAGDHGLPASPATSPNVLSVGGTRLTMANGAYYSETVWNDGYDNSHVWWATGGGYSKSEARPSYQNGFDPSSRRGAVDVAMNAESNTYIYSQAYNGWVLEGGTSAAAPEMSAMLAVANQGRALSGRAAFSGANSAIYALPSSDFHDITSGNNGYYYAASGWDSVTGRGTPVANRFVYDLAYSNYSSTAQYGLNTYVGIAALRQSPNYYFASLTNPMVTVAAAAHIPTSTLHDLPANEAPATITTPVVDSTTPATQPVTNAASDSLLLGPITDDASAVAPSARNVDALFGQWDDLSLPRLGSPVTDLALE